MVTHLWRLVEDWRAQQRFPVSQSALARDIGVERSAVSQWKKGQARPSPANMRAIQSATGIRYRDLLDALLMDMGYLDPPAGATSAASGVTPLRPGDPQPPTQEEIDSGEVAADVDRD